MGYMPRPGNEYMSTSKTVTSSRKGFLQRPLFRSLTDRLAAHRHISIYTDARDLTRQSVIKVVFIRDGALTDMLLRLWDKRSLVLVRARNDGSFPPGALSIVSKLSNARYVFPCSDSLRDVLREKPALRGASRLMLRSPLEIFSDRSRLLSLRIQDCDGNPDSELIEAPLAVTDITLWLSHPAPRKIPAGQIPQGIVYLDVPAVDPLPRSDVEAAIRNTYPDRALERWVQCCGLGDPLTLDETLEAIDETRTLLVTRDATMAAYLSHWGYASAVLRENGDITPNSTFSTDGMTLITHLSASGLYDLRLRRSLNLADFLSYEDGCLGQRAVLLRAINRHIVDPEDKLQLLALARARAFDASFAADLGLFFDALIARLDGQSLQRATSMRRLAARLNSAGLIVSQAPQHSPTISLNHLENQPKRAAYEMAPPKRIQSVKSSLRGKLINLGVRTYSRLGEKRLLQPFQRLFARRIAQLGLEAGFELFAGLSGSPANARKIAANIEQTLKDREIPKAVICARLYLASGATSEGMRVLKRCTGLTSAHHGKILSCLYRTGHIQQGLDWFEALPDALKINSNIVMIAATLLLNGRGREEAFAYLKRYANTADMLSVTIRSMLGRLAITEGDHELAFLHLSQVVETGNENPGVLQAWAQAMRVTGRASATIHQLQSTRFANNPRAGLLLSYLLVEEGDLMGALSVALAAFHMDPGSAVLTANVVLLANSGGAGQILGDILRQHAATSVDAKVTAAMHCMSQRDFAAAGRYLDAATQAGAEPLRRTYMQARLLLHEEQLDAAAHSLKQAFAIDPTRLSHILLATDIAERRGDSETVARYSEMAALIAPNDHRVLEMRARQAEREHRYAEAEAYTTRSAAARRGAALRDDLRTSWSLFKLRAGLRDREGALDAFGQLISGLHQLFPVDVIPWKGGTLEGRSVLVMSRGGPGDEVRTLQIAGRLLTRMGATVSFLGDNRMQEMFQQNFPDGTFFSNQLAGSKLRADEIAQLNMPRMQAGAAEIARRQGVYIRANTFERFDHILFADDVVLHELLPDILGNTLPEFEPLDIDPACHAHAREIIEALPGEGPVVTLSWRGSYFSPNRPSAAYLQIPELGPLLSIPGVRFIDTHPNTSEIEHEEIFNRFGVRLHRPESVNFRDDLALLGALMCKADANIVPPVTQRDLAAAVGAPNLWSFDVISGITESWRVHEETQMDLWQPGIHHHTLRALKTREAVVTALADRVKGLL